MFRHLSNQKLLYFALIELIYVCILPFVNVIKKRQQPKLVDRMDNVLPVIKTSQIKHHNKDGLTL